MVTRKTLKKRVGFTLIEILVVIVIIGVLSIIGVSKYTEFITTSRQRGCVANQTTIDKTIGVWESQNVAIPQFDAAGKAISGYSVTFTSTGKIAAAAKVDALAAPAANKLATGSTVIARLTKDANIFACPEHANQVGGIEKLQEADGNEYSWFSDGNGKLNSGKFINDKTLRGTFCITFGDNGPDSTKTTAHQPGAELTGAETAGGGGS